MAFKIGDKVRTVREYMDDGTKLFPIGTVGIIECVEEGDDLPYKVAVGAYDYWWYSESMLEPYEQKTYEQGLADAWELAKKVMFERNDGGIPIADLTDVFGTISLVKILKNYTAEEALAKVKACEERSKIAPSKVVEDTEGTRALVLDECDNGVFYVLTENGCVENWHREGCTVVSGKTIDVSELVKQIGERENGV